MGFRTNEVFLEIHRILTPGRWPLVNSIPAFSSAAFIASMALPIRDVSAPATSSPMVRLFRPPQVLHCLEKCLGTLELTGKSNPSAFER